MTRRSLTRTPDDRDVFRLTSTLVKPQDRSVVKQGIALLSALALSIAATTDLASAHRHTAAAYCPPKRSALKGVYHPIRLHVLVACQRAIGTVRSVRHEDDGDLHIDVGLLPPFKRLLNDKNYSLQHGWLVVEFMPRDSGHLPRPSIGDKVTLVGAWVLDSEHGWREIHPVWRLVLHGRLYTSGPQYGGSPTYARSRNAEATCRDQNQHRCVGY